MPAGLVSHTSSQSSVCSLKSLLFSCDVDAIEKDRYKPFTQLANTVLDAWNLHRKELENEMGFRRPSDDQSLILQRNDPQSTSSTHRSADGHRLHGDSQRSPDLIALPLKTAMKTCNGNNFNDTPLTSDSWVKHAKIAPDCAHHTPGFSEVLMSWVVEFAGEERVPSVPSSFRHRALSACESYPFLSLTSNVLKARPPPSAHTSHTTMSTSAASKTNGTKRQASEMEEAEGLGRVSKAPRRSLTSQAKNESDVDQSSTSHTNPYNSTARNSSAEVQSAIYAAERLCASPFLTHALNAVVISE